MEIKVILENEEIITNTNGTLTEIAMRYFPNKAVQKIEILSGGIYETEYYKQTPLEIYRVDPKEVKEFQLWNNIRFSFLAEYKQGQAANHVSSAALCNIA